MNTPAHPPANPNCENREAVNVNLYLSLPVVRERGVAIGRVRADQREVACLGLRGREHLARGDDGRLVILRLGRLLADATLALGRGLLLLGRVCKTQPAW